MISLVRSEGIIPFFCLHVFCVTSSRRGLTGRVELMTGHTRFLLPRLRGRVFGVVFMDVWGSQYGEVLEACPNRRRNFMNSIVLIKSDEFMRGLGFVVGFCNP